MISAMPSGQRATCIKHTASPSSRSVAGANGGIVVLRGEAAEDPRRLPHFRRDMLLYDNQGQDPATVQALLEELRNTNPVSRGLLLPDGQGISLASAQRLLGFTPS